MSAVYGWMMVSEEEIQAKMKELDKEMGGLLCQDTLRRYAMSSLGVQSERPRQENAPQFKKLADLKDREEISVNVMVTRIPAPRPFKKKDGSQGRVVNITIKDDTGSCRLALWDDEVELIASLPILEGSRLCCERCYVKVSEYGIDLSPGRSGRISILN
jgi:replication factor A1